MKSGAQKGRLRPPAGIWGRLGVCRRLAGEDRLKQNFEVSKDRVCNKTGYAFQVLGRAGAKSQRREQFPGDQRGWKFRKDGSTREPVLGSESGGCTCVQGPQKHGKWERWCGVRTTGPLCRGHA